MCPHIITPLIRLSFRFAVSYCCAARLSLFLLAHTLIVLICTGGAQSDYLIPDRPEVAGAVSMDGTLGAFSRAGTLILADLASRTLRWGAGVEAGSIGALAFSHEGSSLALALSHFRDRSLLGEPIHPFVSVVVFDTATAQKREEMVYDGATMIKALSYAPDGSILAVIVHNDGRTLLWDAKRHQITALSTQPQAGNCTAVFSPSGNSLAWATTAQRRHLRECEVRLMDTASHLETGVARRLSRSLSVPLAFSPDGAVLAFSTVDWNEYNTQPTQITLFSLVSHRVTGRIRTAEIDTGSLAFSADGGSILGTGFDLGRDVVRPINLLRRMCLWNTATGEFLKKVEEPYKTFEFASISTKVLRVPRRNLYVCLSTRGKVSFYDSASLRLLFTIPISNPSTSPKPTPKISVKRPNSAYTVSVHHVLALSFLSKSRFMVGKGDGAVQLWNIPPLTPPGVLQLNSPAKALAISPDSGTIAVSQFGDPDIGIVDAALGTLVRRLRAFAEPAFALAYSSDGAWLAAATDDTIRIWNTKTWESQITLSGNHGAVETLAFSRDSRLLACGSDDRFLRVWHVASGVLAHALPGFRKGVGAVAFGAESSILAGASAADSSVTMWKLHDSQNPIKFRPLITQR